MAARAWWARHRKTVTLAGATAAGHAVRAAPGVAGWGLVSVGAWMAWHPAGFVTAGVLLLADLVAERIAPKGGGK